MEQPTQPPDPTAVTPRQPDSATTSITDHPNDDPRWTVRPVPEVGGSSVLPVSLVVTAVILSTCLLGALVGSGVLVLIGGAAAFLMFHYFTWGWLLKRLVAEQQKQELLDLVEQDGKTLPDPAAAAALVSKFGHHEDSPMRAMAFAQPGGVEVLQMMDLPTPVIDDDEVMVQVKACGLNHLDVWVRKGLPTQITMPHVGGCETTGVVAEVGKKVKTLSAGQRVMISPGQSDRNSDWTNQNLDNLDEAFVTQGYQTQGGFAEYAKAKACDVLPISEAWSFAEWAATPLTFVTAWNMLHRRAGVKPNDEVVVFGASSGVGVAAIQIAKAAQARVFAVAGSEEKLKKAADLGADVLLNYNTQDLAKEVKTRTGGRGADIVIEHVGLAVWAQALKCLGRNGRLVTCGETTGPKVEIDLRFFFSFQHNILGAYMGSRSDLLQCVKLLEKRVFRPVVDSVFPLEKLREAQERMERRELFGKIVVTP